jgi:hypothetical protein
VIGGDTLSGSGQRPRAPLSRFHIRAPRRDAELHGRACTLLAPHRERASHECCTFTHPWHSVVTGRRLTRQQRFIESLAIVLHA